MRVQTIAVLVVIAASCEGLDSAGIAEFVVTDLDTLVTQESELLAGPSELTVLDDGRLLITDTRANQLLRLDVDGAVLDTIGGSGSGPGEFQSPRSTAVERDTIRVVDGGNGRVQVLTVTGAYVRSWPLAAAALSGSIAFLAGGQYIVSRNGRDSALAQRFSAAGDAGRLFGTPVVAGTGVWHFPTVKAAINDGRVPDEIRNIATPFVASDGSAWLVLNAEGIVHRYDVDDSLQWSVPLAEPEFDTIKMDFFARNRAEGDPTRLYTLVYLVDGQPIRDELWVLLWPVEGAGVKLIVFDGTGSVVRHVRVPSAQGVRIFAVDHQGRYLYMVANDDATLLRAPLPPMAVNR